MATASGTNNGFQSVVVTSSAIGGVAYLGVLGGTDGVSGDATAMSTAFGLGVVTSTATATGNFSVNGGVAGGAALAHASATGQSGNATATANTGGGIFTAIQASATAPVGVPPASNRVHVSEEPHQLWEWLPVYKRQRL